MTPRRTMSIAQQLYEGVDITGARHCRTYNLHEYRLAPPFRRGAGSRARTLSSTATARRITPASRAISRPRPARRTRTRPYGPTDVELTPELVRKDLTQEQYRLYRLIWGRFTACQMANAVYDNVAVDVVSAGCSFRATYSEMKFAGYTAVYEEAKDEESAENPNPLPVAE